MGLDDQDISSLARGTMSVSVHRCIPSTSTELSIGLAEKFIQLVTALFNKVLGKYEKYIFYFYTLSQMNFLANLIFEG